MYYNLEGFVDGLFFNKDQSNLQEMIDIIPPGNVLFEGCVDGLFFNKNQSNLQEMIDIIPPGNVL